MNCVTWTFLSAGPGWVWPGEAPAGNRRPAEERGGVSLPTPVLGAGPPGTLSGSDSAFTATGPPGSFCPH